MDLIEILIVELLLLELLAILFLNGTTLYAFIGWHGWPRLVELFRNIPSSFRQALPYVLLLLLITPFLSPMSWTQTLLVLPIVLFVGPIVAYILSSNGFLRQPQQI